MKLRSESCNETPAGRQCFQQLQPLIQPQQQPQRIVQAQFLHLHKEIERVTELRLEQEQQKILLEQQRIQQQELLQQQSQEIEQQQQQQITPQQPRKRQPRKPRQQQQPQEQEQEQQQQQQEQQQIMQQQEPQQPEQNIQQQTERQPLFKFIPLSSSSVVSPSERQQQQQLLLQPQPQQLLQPQTQLLLQPQQLLQPQPQQLLQPQLLRPQPQQLLQPLRIRCEQRPSVIRPSVSIFQPVRLPEQINIQQPMEQQEEQEQQRQRTEETRPEQQQQQYNPNQNYTLSYGNNPIQQQHFQLQFQQQPHSYPGHVIVNEVGSGSLQLQQPAFFLDSSHSPRCYDMWLETRQLKIQCLALKQDSENWRKIATTYHNEILENHKILHALLTKNVNTSQLEACMDRVNDDVLITENEVTRLQNAGQDTRNNCSVLPHEMTDIRNRFDTRDPEAVRLNRSVAKDHQKALKLNIDILKTQEVMETTREHNEETSQTTQYRLSPMAGTSNKDQKELTKLKAKLKKLMTKTSELSNEHQDAKNRSGKIVIDDENVEKEYKKEYKRKYKYLVKEISWLKDRINNLESCGGDKSGSDDEDSHTDGE